jgi:hypothetical protein
MANPSNHKGGSHGKNGVSDRARRGASGMAGPPPFAPAEGWRAAINKAGAEASPALQARINAGAGRRSDPRPEDATAQAARALDQRNGGSRRQGKAVAEPGTKNKTSSD